MATMVAAGCRCATRAPRNGSRLGLAAFAWTRLLLGGRCVFVRVPVLSSFRAIKVSSLFARGCWIIALPAVFNTAPAVLRAQGLGCGVQDLARLFQRCKLTTRVAEETSYRYSD